MKTLVAFSNTSGGTLIIGKKDNGAIVGVDDVFSAEEKLMNAIADNISPLGSSDKRRVWQIVDDFGSNRHIA